MMLSPQNSLVTLVEADAYHADRLTPGWATAATEVREAACVRATDYIRTRYNLAEGVEGDDPALKAATCALAAHALTSTLSEAATADVLSEEGDAGKITYGKAPSDPYPSVTAMLTGIASRKGGSFWAARALI